MATVIFPTRGTYLTLSIFLSESSSTFLKDATLTIIVLGEIHAGFNLYAFDGTPSTMTSDSRHAFS
eukprot:CAMPEP_0182535548 /NCGR_PEP_ID=MMETSP1323-20130603/18151_1 /TAXON_ID=236787 /ORGANISM="Florenciella parvula, Strain RCC1693" /LENGTH=65 /DNA_ID=CAMNT_0024745695 /DNA_START=516 /DNA_END=713 /DNA_ORIENTATION=+